MKKILIGTSALVAAAAFAGSANAADPIKLSVGGYGAVMVGYASNDDAYVTALGQEVSAVDVKGDNEIHFSGKTTLDNGLTVAVKYEFEAGGRSAQTTNDEWSIAVSGNFGTIKTGADDNALMMIHNNAPVVGGRLFNGGAADNDVLGGAYVLRPTSAAGVGALADTGINTGGDSESISYISPSFAGFTFGASYVPSVDQGENVADATNQSASAVSDGYGVGLAYAGKFGDVTVGADIGWLTADNGNTVDSHNQYQAGLKFGYAGFEVGGAYRALQQDGIEGRKDQDGRSWEAGVSYKTGPYGISLTYFDISVEQDQTINQNIGDDEAQMWQLSTSYNMGPGVDLVGGLAYVSFDSTDSNGVSGALNSNDGWVAATGLSLTF